MVEYGSLAESRRESSRGLGDPMTVARETRATTRSLAKWAEAATGRPERVGLYREILARLLDDDLETWGYPRAAIEAELGRIDPAGRPAPRPALTRYTLERKLLVALRRWIRPENRLGGLVRKLRETLRRPAPVASHPPPPGAARPGPLPSGKNVTGAHPGRAESCRSLL